MCFLKQFAILPDPLQVTRSPVQAILVPTRTIAAGQSLLHANPPQPA
jgi:hypothetical protein